jgi:hypothetical protein
MDNLKLMKFVLTVITLVLNVKITKITVLNVLLTESKNQIVIVHLDFSIMVSNKPNVKLVTTNVPPVSMIKKTV